MLWLLMNLLLLLLLLLLLFLCVPDFLSSKIYLARCRVLLICLTKSLHDIKMVFGCCVRQLSLSLSLSFSLISFGVDGFLSVRISSAYEFFMSLGALNYPIPPDLFYSSSVQVINNDKNGQRMTANSIAFILICLCANLAFARNKQMFSMKSHFDFSVFSLSLSLYILGTIFL